MAESGIKSYFPSQTVSDAEKLSYDYGLKVAKAIETEWFHQDRGADRYNTYQNNFHTELTQVSNSLSLSLDDLKSKSTILTGIQSKLADFSPHS